MTCAFPNVLNIILSKLYTCTFVLNNASDIIMALFNEPVDTYCIKYIRPQWGSNSAGWVFSSVFSKLSVYCVSIISISVTALFILVISIEYFSKCC